MKKNKPRGGLPKMIFRKDRYFIVFYHGTNEIGPVTGQINITTNEGFLCRKSLIQEIKDCSDIPMDKVVITNFIEVNKKEFECWKSTEI